jgi:hypothetical protein
MSDTPQHHRITIEPIVAAFTPYAMSLISNDMFLMASGYYHDNKISLAQHYLFCASTEIALKAAILADDCTKERKAEIKQMNHNLERGLNRFRAIYGDIFSDEEKATLKQINKYYQNKGLEYFTIEVMGTALRGYKDVPDLVSIKSLAKTANTFLNENKLFLNAKTSEKPSGGFINLV